MDSLGVGLRTDSSGPMLSLEETITEWPGWEGETLGLTGSLSRTSNL